MSSVRSALLASILGGFGATDAVARPVVHGPALLDSPSFVDTDQLTVDALVRDTRRILDQAGIAAVITGRVKTPSSIHAKMRRKGVSYDEIYDRLALRIRVDDEAAAYHVRELLEARHRVIDGERDDYIAQPKANGYQSLHSALETRLGDVAEFQIRTHAMHAHAEGGDAAHWRYKLATNAA